MAETHKAKETTQKHATKIQLEDLIPKILNVHLSRMCYFINRLFMHPQGNN